MSARAVTATQTMTRTVVASFAAGVSAMVVAGMTYSIIANGGLMREAEASTFEPRGQLIEPLDVDAIEAQLAVSHERIEAAQAATDADRLRLERVAGR